MRAVSEARSGRRAMSESEAMARRKVWILGAGGHASVGISAALAADIPVANVFDDAAAKSGAELLGFRVATPIPTADAGFPTHVAIGSNRVRLDLVTARSSWDWISIAHPAAWIDPRACIGPGALICAGACVQVGAFVGRHAIVNTHASVDHDCQIGDYAHIGPGTVLSGGVKVGEGAFLGAGACVAPGLSIGAWAVVGAGAVVIRDVPAGATVVGNPAQRLVERGAIAGENLG